MFNNIFLTRNRRTFRLLVALAAILTMIFLYMVFTQNNTEETLSVIRIKSVTVKNVADISLIDTFEVVGTVQAISEATLQTEAGGRVTAVNSEIGQSVRAGAVLATIENRSESASLLQAQGAYEAALAGAASSNVSVEQANNVMKAAQNAALTAVRAAYTNVSHVYYTNLTDVLDDKFFTSPSVILIGSSLPIAKSEGKAIERLLPTWQAFSVTLTTNSDLESALLDAKTNTLRTIALVDILIKIFNETSTSQAIVGVSVETQRINMSNLRASLNETLSALESSEIGLKNASETVTLAQLGSTGGVVSAANAQIKIALGSLRAAQANYEKTIVRTPISGVINALYLKTGDYVSPSQPAAIVANNQGLQILTAVSSEDSQTLAVGDEVTIDDTSSGIITALASALDPTTGKVAIKVSVSENATLKNGSTVTLSFTKNRSQAEHAQDIIVPLSALKMTAAGPVVFFVGNDSKLTSQPVVLGVISGDRVIITEGLTLLDAIVTDARGLKTGQTVSVTKK
ncbi:MAG: hypothetical protein AUK16_00925 [Parcubacteria group bacterium CG2_30_44_11]|nr:MAG: hypothetical protein AUK16_00925 [Parcubacteria group bacterium CG2_30_44_11]